ncbi:MAG: hypothetical protein K0B15_00360 [Lentimicrobium sp.]|nr:hypothetical protein [Lentimicrobium sp.]
MVTFLIETEGLSQILNRLKIVQKLNKGKKKVLMCEVTVKKGCIELSTPGLFQVLEARTSGTCKFVIPVSFFTKVVASYKNDYLNFAVSKGMLEMENYICNANTTFFEDDSVLRSIQLPINFKSSDLLPLTGIEYTKEELEFNNLAPHVEKAKRKLVMDLLAASQMLSDYDISYKELKAYTCDRLKINPGILDDIEMNLIRN